MMLSPAQFQKTLLNWFDVHGRKSLPWQHNKSPYRVWVSEIMLQQTQVNTVIPYYLRFLQRFPNVYSLANATEDEVLHLWAGLGYYSRARNLHRAAKMIVTEYAGELPNTPLALQSLPGIGQSTAGALLAIAFNQPAAILDGNVKRVLSRLHGITDPINEKSIENKLWEQAVRYTPKKRVADYTQAMMDLGATLCTRSKPDCAHCPFHQQCSAYQQDLVALIPYKKTADKIPTRSATLLILKHKDRVLLHKRPASGIWGGLFSLPEIAGDPHAETIRLFCQQHYQLNLPSHKALPTFRHTFSHYHLMISPVLLECQKMPRQIMEEGKQIWYNLRQPEPVGLPKPIQSILRGLI